MDKSDVLNGIRRTEEEIERLKRELNQQNKNYEIICECEQENRKSMNRFEESIRRRREKLFSFDFLTSIAKFAAGYSRLMKEELTGNDYRNAVDQIGEIEKSISNKKSEIRNEIFRLEREIRDRESQLSSQYDQYNNWEDESCQTM